jgi:hypothetical protein
MRLSAHRPRARIVCATFHVLRHVNAALDETRRAEFFRQGRAPRALLRGERWPRLCALLTVPQATADRLPSITIGAA